MVDVSRRSPKSYLLWMGSTLAKVAFSFVIYATYFKAFLNGAGFGLGNSFFARVKSPRGVIVSDKSESARDSESVRDSESRNVDR